MVAMGKMAFGNLYQTTNTIAHEETHKLYPPYNGRSDGDPGVHSLFAEDWGETCANHLPHHK